MTGENLSVFTCGEFVTRKCCLDLQHFTLKNKTARIKEIKLYHLQQTKIVIQQ